LNNEFSFKRAVRRHGNGIAGVGRCGRATVATSYPLRTYATPTGRRCPARPRIVHLRDPGKQRSATRNPQGPADGPQRQPGLRRLFALAGAEMKQDSVSEIRDGSYNGGAAIPCDCFETGEKWHYVWTRDLSYAADLGLAMLDPQRVRNSLNSKLSGYREGVKPPQHGRQRRTACRSSRTPAAAAAGRSAPTASAGPSAPRRPAGAAAGRAQAFAATRAQGLTNTIENDRLAAFDRVDGLYNGEQSFLDWRDQSYAPWIAGDLASHGDVEGAVDQCRPLQGADAGRQLAREQGDAALASEVRGLGRGPETRHQRNASGSSRQVACTAA
jgi:hypothetical protein